MHAIFNEFFCIGYMPCPIAYIIGKMEVKSEKTEDKIEEKTELLNRDDFKDDFF